MGTELYRILAIDDDPDNLLAIKGILDDAFPHSLLFTALSGQQGIELARIDHPNVILLDMSMPNMDGFQTCWTLKSDERLQHVPIIILTAHTTDRALRVKALQSGAEAFLTKPIDEVELTAQIRVMAKMHLLYLRQKEEAILANSLADQIKEKSREELAAVYNHAPVGICLFNEKLQITRLNQAAIQLAGNGKIDLIGLTCGQWLGCINSSNEFGGCGKGPLCKPCSLQHALHSSLTTGQEHMHIEVQPWLNRDNQIERYHLTGSCIRISSDESKRVLLCLDDITNIKELEKERLQMVSALEMSINEIYLFDAQTYKFKYANLSALNNLGYSIDILKRKTPLDIKPELSREKFEQLITPLKDRKQKSVSFCSKHRRKDGSLYPTEAVLQLCEHDNDAFYLAVIQDITERQAMEAKLRQSQKLECIGQLAGGVAHDFNNLLAATMIHLNLLQENASLDLEMQETLKELLTGARRAANLTRQLLMFSRRSYLETRMLNLNDVVDNTHKML